MNHPMIVLPKLCIVYIFNMKIMAWIRKKYPEGENMVYCNVHSYCFRLNVTKIIKLKHYKKH